MYERIVTSSFKPPGTDDSTNMWISRCHDIFFSVVYKKDGQQWLALTRKELEVLGTMIEVALRETDPTHDPVSGNPIDETRAPQSYF